VTPAPERRRKRFLLAAQLIGLVLLALALYFAFSQRDVLSRALDSLRAAPAWQIALVIALPLVHWTLMAQLFCTLTNQYGHVRLGEMHVLMGSAWLLNLLPMRPGLLSRVAYAKLVNHVQVRDSVKITIFSVVTQGAATGVVVLILAVVHTSTLALSLSADHARALLLALALGAIALTATLTWLLRTGERRIGGPAPIDAWRVTLGVLLRLLDSCAWTARYALAFHVIGHPIGLTQAAAISAVSQIVGMTPVQLGLREWAVGLCARFLPATTARTAVGLSADLLNRAAELLVSVPLGLACSLLVWRRLARAQREQPPADPNRTPPARV
jgi:hypothetical protein